MNVNKYTGFGLTFIVAAIAYGGLFAGFNDMGVQFAIAQGVVCVLASVMPKIDLGIAGLRGCDNDPNALFEGIQKAISGLQDRIKEQAETIAGKMEKGEKITHDLKAQVDEALTDLNARFKELEQKAASGIAVPGGKPQFKSVGEQFVESEGYESFKGRNDKTSVKATITTTLAGGNAGDGLMTPAYRDNDLVRIPRRVTVDDLIPVINIDSSSVDYAKQKTRNNNAAMVAEAGEKPYSDYSWESATVPVRTMAHLAKITRQAWEDAPRLIGEINSELIYGLDLLRESQILFGTGVGQNLHGIVPQATSFVAPTGAPTTGLTRIDVLRLAMLNLVLRGYRPDGHVLNTADWAYIELLKDGEGRYLVSSPFTGARPQLWGLPVLDTPAMAQGDFLTGAFRIGATYYRRMGIEIRLSTENDKDFEQNLGTLRAEERGALAVKRPQAFEYGSFDDVLNPAPGGGEG